MTPKFTLKDAGSENRIFRARVIVAIVLMALLMATVVARLALLQIIRHDHYTTLSRENRVKIVPIAPTRGLIYSHDGVLLAENRPTFSLDVIPEQVPNLKNTIARLRRIINITDADVTRFYKDLKEKRRFENVPIRYNLSEEEVARFAVARPQFPGVDINARLTRYYPHGPDFVHVVGYVGRIDLQELQSVDASNYSATTHIGKTGVERSYEKVLHGKVGYQQVEVNAQGRVLRVLDRTPPEPGKDLHLTIDADLQETAIEAFGDHRGAVVAVDPNTGAVLAMVSRPGYDPNLFVNGIDAKTYKTLRDSLDRPLFNRVLQGQYPPGSTVKPFLGLGALYYGVRTKDATTWCPGWYSLPGDSHRYRCWRKWGHGKVALEQAIYESCDVYFYALAHDMGIDRMYKWMTKFGFGKKTGIDLVGESSGLMPSREWKRKTRNLPWFPGETLITGIGQGFTLVTPLQLAMATAAMGMRGIRVRPHVVGAIVNPMNGKAKDVDPEFLPPVEDQNQSQWDTVIDAMHQVVQGPHGTARAVGLKAAYPFAGKTGTAQVRGVRQNETYNEADIPERERDHALFIAFAPEDHPKLAVAVIVENGGHGGSAAAPIAKALFDRYLLGKTPKVPADNG